MKKRLFWIVELFIWLLILVLISGVIMFAKYHHRKDLNTYQIFLPDVDGLINGSPVKLLGIQIGYVNQIDIVGEDVYVKFLITEPKVKIPAGSTATVEFSGLGGSKSLELYPPSKNRPTSDKLITVQSPKRISESIGVLNQMFDQIVEITYTVSSFMDKIGVIKSKNKMEEISSKSANQFLDYSNKWLDNTQKQCNKLTKKLNQHKDRKNESD